MFYLTVSIFLYSEETIIQPSLCKSLVQHKDKGWASELRRKQRNLSKSDLSIDINDHLYRSTR